MSKSGDNLLVLIQVDIRPSLKVTSTAKQDQGLRTDLRAHLEADGLERFAP